MGTILTYDGSFEGLLTCIFEVYEHKLNDCIVQKSDSKVVHLFYTVKQVETETFKAARVWKGIAAKASTNAQHQLFCLYLSEQDHVEEVTLGYLRYLFNSKVNVERDYSNKFVLELLQMERKVHREKHRMEAFVRFKLTKDNIYFATIEPDFNVLPLIMSHFKKRYSDQQWIIYDIKRNVGMYYNLHKVVDVTYTFNETPGSSAASTIWFDEQEELYQILWKDYFRTTNIPARKNTKLHLQHVPKRYWKYLVEKQ